MRMGRRPPRRVNVVAVAGAAGSGEQEGGTDADAQWYPNMFEVGWPDVPHRALRNSTAEAREAAGRPPLGRRPGAGDVIAHFADSEPIVRYSTAASMVDTTGDVEACSLWAGQSVALARQPQPAAEIVAELVSGL